MGRGWMEVRKEGRGGGGRRDKDEKMNRFLSFLLFKENPLKMVNKKGPTSGSDIIAICKPHWTMGMTPVLASANGTYEKRAYAHEKNE